MALFRRKPKTQIVHPAVVRTIHLRCDDAGLLGPHLESYASIQGRQSRELLTRLDIGGGWLKLALPSHGVHPWEANNLAYWLLELGDVLVVSGPSPTFPAHWLAPSSTLDDLLEGWTDEGEPISIHVPSGRLIRADAEVTEPRLPATERLRTAGVPLDGWTPAGQLAVRSEDPQHDLGPVMDLTAADRKALRALGLISWTP